MPTGKPAQRTARALTIEDAAGQIATRVLDDGDSLVIGRGKHCDIVISDPSISLVHSRIRLVDGLLTITAFAPDDNLVINGVPSSTATIADGAEALLRIGDKSLKLRLTIPEQPIGRDSAFRDLIAIPPVMQPEGQDARPTRPIASKTHLGAFEGQIPIDAFYEPEHRLLILSWHRSSTAQQLTHIALSLLHRQARGADEHRVLATFRGVGKNWDFAFRVSAGALRDVASIAHLPLPSVSDDDGGEWLSMAVDLPFGQIFASVTEEFGDAICRISSPLEEIEGVVRFRELLAWIPCGEPDRFQAWVNNLAFSIKRALPRRV